MVSAAGLTKGYGFAAVELTRPLVAGTPVSGVLLHLAVLAAYWLVGLSVELILARLLITITTTTTTTTTSRACSS